MNKRIQSLVEQIAGLEEELATVLHEQEDELLYHLQGKRIEFEESIKQAHKKLKTGVLPWLFGRRPINIITSPIIYGMALPLVMLDLLVSLYQLTCFPIYRIEMVRRSEYFLFDRRHLAYLNVFERLHCMYCSYATGLVAYFAEILARTEQYFCPIKHSRNFPGTHSRYAHFLDFGDADRYSEKLEAFRTSLASKENQ
jgi:hypothetical protein